MARTTNELRPCTLLCAFIGIVLMALALWLQLEAFLDHRARDFLRASEVSTFDTIGTCVEAPSEDQLKGSGFEDNNKCVEAIDENTNTNEKAEKMARVLEASVHALYSVSSTSPVTIIVANAVVDASADTRVINYKTAYQALQAVANSADLKTSCDEIYTGSAAQYDKDYKPPEGHSPHTKLNVKCDDENTPSDDAADDSGITLDNDKQELLYNHCVRQFGYGTSGLDDDVYHMPIVGKDPGIDFVGDFYKKPDGFDDKDTTDATKARVYVGRRFGFYAWALIPMLLASSFLFGDAVIFFLSDLTYEQRIDSMASTKNDPNSASALRDLQTKAATINAARIKRFFLGVLLVLISTFFYGLFLAGPLGIVDSTMPRPECYQGIESDDWMINLRGEKGTVNGWKSDYPAQVRDLLALVFQWIVLILIPLSSTRFGDFFNACCASVSGDNGGGGGDGAEGAQNILTDGQTDSGVIAPVGWKYKMLMRTYLPLLMIASIFIILGQSIAAANFGFAWSEAVVGTRTHGEGDKKGQLYYVDGDVQTLGKVAFDQVLGFVCMILVIGLVTGAVLQKYSFIGTSFLNFIMYVFWILIVLGFLLPLLVFAEIVSSLDYNDVSECERVDNWVCSVRQGFVLTGLIIFIGVIVLVTLANVLRKAYKTMRTPQESGTATRTGTKRKWTGPWSLWGNGRFFGARANLNHEPFDPAEFYRYAEHRPLVLSFKA
jgi:hypothetical protein